MLFIETSTFLGSLQKFEGAAGEFKGALCSRHPLISSPAFIDAHSNQKQPYNFDEILQSKAKLGKIFDGEILIITLLTNLLQIFCKTFHNISVIVLSIIDTDDNK